MTAFLLWVRRLVLATAVPPVIHLYRLGYQLVIQQALRLFRRYPATRAVYLKRGIAKGEDLPGLSDIDFTIIGVWSETDRTDLEDRLAGLARRIRILDPFPEIYTEASIQTDFATKPALRYRLTEGKATWRLLYGRDYLADLPDATHLELADACFAETQVWWSILMRRLVHPNPVRHDPITRYAIGYKTLAETLKMEAALLRDDLVFTRREALAQAKPYLNEADRQVVTRLEALQARRYLGHDPTLVDDTLACVLRRLNHLYTALAAHPLTHPQPATLRVDSPVDEVQGITEARWRLTPLVDYARRAWGEGYAGAYLAPSLYFSVDELALLLKINLDQPPTLDELSQLYALLQTAQPPNQRLFLYVLLPQAAFQVDCDDPSKPWQTTMLPGLYPDLFQLLALPGYVLDGAPLAPPPATWTAFSAYFLQIEEGLFYDLLNNPLIYKVNTLDFLRTFWKTLQIVVVNRSARQGAVVFPLTLSAIRRAVEAQGLPSPVLLDTLQAAMDQELAGQESDIVPLIPAALQYLRAIKSDTSSG